MKLVIWILLLLPFLHSCSSDAEDKDDAPDYRDRFIGDYQCNKRGTYHCGDSTVYVDTIVIVSLAKRSDSLIQIFGATLKINTNGEFGGGLYPDSAYHGFGGNLTGDSIFFTTYQGGLGCFTSLNYKGKKR